MVAINLQLSHTLELNKFVRFILWLALTICVSCNVYKIIWIVRAFWLEYKCVFIALWSKLYEFRVRASFIVFLFVKTENNNFIKEILKHVVRASIHLLKTSAKFVRILEQVKTFDCVSGFHWSALEFSQTFASVFTRCMEARTTCFNISFTKLRHGKHVLWVCVTQCTVSIQLKFRQLGLSYAICKSLNNQHFYCYRLPLALNIKGPWAPHSAKMGVLSKTERSQNLKLSCGCGKNTYNYMNCDTKLHLLK